MPRRWKYRGTSTSTLNAYVSVLSKPGLRWLFSDQLADIELELLARDLESIADESGGWLAPWVQGWQ